MVNVIGVLFIAGGLGGIAAFFYFAALEPVIQPQLGLLLDLLLIAVGAGILRRRESARLLAQALFLVGAFALLFAVGHSALSWKSSGHVSTGLAFVPSIAALLPPLAPAMAKAAALALLGALLVGESLGAAWLYDYFQRPEIVAQFNGGDGKSRGRLYVYALATAYVAVIPFYPVVLSLS